MSEFRSPPTEHNHEKVSCKDLQMLDLRSACKRKATEDLNVRASKIICAEAKHFSEVDFNDVNKLSQSIYKERLKMRPTLPKSTADVFKTLSTLKNSSIRCPQPNKCRWKCLYRYCHCFALFDYKFAI